MIYMSWEWPLPGISSPGLTSISGCDPGRQSGGSTNEKKINSLWDLSGGERSKAPVGHNGRISKNQNVTYVAG